MKYGSLLEKLDRLPPCLCRLFARTRLARTGWHPKSHREIAAEAGLAKSTVADLSRLRSWRHVPLEMADTFARACGVNLAEIEEAISRLRTGRSRLKHLAAGNAQQRRMIAELLKESKRPKE